MCKFVLNGKSGKSQILIGDINELYAQNIIPEDSIYITDDNLAGIYPGFFSGKKLISIPNGEENKTIRTVNHIFDELIELNADRKSYIVGVGGGMITDIAGFVASTYMRGTKFGFIPTSLLAMIDASIGGKNGVNHHNYKNMIGTINQPAFVMIDPAFLKTLPGEEYTNGMAEAIKHLLIADKEKFFQFYSNTGLCTDKNNVPEADFLCHQIEVKVKTVNSDELEKGKRKRLNFGHTFGHPIEKILGLKHGYAVSIGMAIAAEISKIYGYLSENEVNIIRNALIKTGLPVSCKIDKNKVIEIMAKDKKKDRDSIDFILLRNIGEAVIEPIEICRLSEMFLDIEL